MDIHTATNKEPLNVKVGTVNALSVNSSGAVGIGTTSNQAVMGLTVLNNQGNYVTLGYNNAISTTSRSLWLSYIGTGTTADYGAIQAEHSNTAYRNLALNPNGGYVGIGKTNPTSALDVNGTLNSTNIYGSYIGLN